MKRIMKFVVLSLFSLLITNSVHGQQAPDWTATDIDGIQHNLHDDLEAGYTVIVKFFATWCGFCWSDHQGGVLQQMYDIHGPDGDDTYRIYYIEVDFNTGMNELQGNTMPIIEGNSIAGQYGISGVPGYFFICPEDKSYIQIQPTNVATLEAYGSQVCPAWTGGPVGSGGGSNPGTTFQGAVAFQGYQVPGQMSTTLADNGLLPMSQPFDSAPFNYDGDETMTTVPDDAVDWILIELRDANDESVEVDRKAALVDKNGNIIGTDGSFGVTFDTATDGDYYVVIHHEGHVSIMSSSTVTMPNSSPYNFKLSNGAVKGTDQMKLTNGAFAMRSGDYDNNGTINFSDFVRWLQNNNDLNIYAAHDGDGNSTINFTDFILWLSNNNHLRYSGI